MRETAAPKTALTGSMSAASLAVFNISIAAFSAEISFDLSLERCSFVLLRPILRLWRGGGGWKVGSTPRRRGKTRESM